MNSPRRRWLTWTLVGAATLVAAPVFVLVAVLGSGSFKSYYLPSEGMAPTLDRSDHIVAQLGAIARPRRGEIIVFAVGDTTYIKRIAGLPGDRIAMKAGVVILNGKAVPQRPVAAETYAGAAVIRLAERFPGEPAGHEVYDSGPNSLDDWPEQVVPKDSLFVLGDNRDNSADSRVPREQGGVALLPLADVRGRAAYVTWPWSKAGRRL